MPNFDLNIWDRVGYETDYESEGWTISVYSIPEEGAPFGSGEYVTGLDLTEEEATILTLGVAEEDGGAYAPDCDFWLDVHGFMEVYPYVPARVKAFLASLDSKEDESDGLLSLWQELGSRKG